LLSRYLKKKGQKKRNEGMKERREEKKAVNKSSASKRQAQTKFVLRRHGLGHFKFVVPIAEKVPGVIIQPRR